MYGWIFAIQFCWPIQNEENDFLWRYVRTIVQTEGSEKNVN